MSQIVISVTIDTARLDAIADKLPATVSKALLTLGYRVEGDAKQFAPVDTGALRNSINTEQVNAMTVHIQDGVEYGIYQELGTRKMKAQPFMIPAVEKNLLLGNYLLLRSGLDK